MKIHRNQKKEKKKYHIITILFITFSILLNLSCARFKIEKLNANEIFNIKISKKTINFPKQSGSYFEIPSKIGIYKDWLIVSEPSHHLIKIFKNNELKIIIISSAHYKAFKKKHENLKQNKIKIISNEHLNTPGRIVSAEESFYVLNYYPLHVQNNENNNYARGSYKILMFNLNGNFESIIGRNAEPDLAFQNILWMDVDSNNNFWIYYTYLDNLELIKYNKKKIIKKFTQKECEKILYKNHKKEKNNLYQCEYMYPFNSGKKILFIGKVNSPSKNNKKVGGHIFQYRIFKTKNLENNEIKTIFDYFNDPEDHPYVPYDDNHIMILQTKNYNTIKFSLYNTEGSLRTNYQIKLDGLRNAWRSTYYNLNGNFYSIKIENNYFKVIRWN